jgi:hypothetical protein
MFARASSLPVQDREAHRIVVVVPKQIFSGLMNVER